jgi:hypothetical protein
MKATTQIRLGPKQQCASLSTQFQSEFFATLTPFEDDLLKLTKAQVEALWKDVVEEEHSLQISRALDDGYSRLVALNVLSQKPQALAIMTRTTFDQYDKKEPLPKPVESLIVDMLKILGFLKDKSVARLRITIPASTGFQMVKHDVQDTSDRAETHVDPEDSLLRVFALLCHDDLSLARHLYANVIYEIQIIFDRFPTQKKRLSSNIHYEFSQLALFGHIIHELYSLFPWAANFGRLLKTCTTSVDNDFGDALYVLKTVYMNGLGPMVMPISRSCYYPIDKAYTSQNVDALRQAEANLDELWQRVNSWALNVGEMSLDDILHRISQRLRELRQTLPYAAPLNEVSHQKPESEVLERALSTLGIQTDKPSRFMSEAPRTKVKTRGQGSAQDDNIRLTTWILSRPTTWLCPLLTRPCQTSLFPGERAKCSARCSAPLTESLFIMTLTRKTFSTPWQQWNSSRKSCMGLCGISCRQRKGWTKASTSTSRTRRARSPSTEHGSLGEGCTGLMNGLGKCSWSVLDLEKMDRVWA